MTETSDAPESGPTGLKSPRGFAITMGIFVGAVVLIVVGAMIAGSQSSSSRQVDPFEAVGDLSQQAHDKGAYAVAEKLIQEPSQIGEICRNLMPGGLDSLDTWIWMASCEHGAQAALEGSA